MAETMILGMMWLKKWNPAIDWKDNNWCWGSRAGRLQCVGATCKGSKTPLVGWGKIELVNALAETAIPKEFQDPFEAFSK